MVAAAGATQKPVLKRDGSLIPPPGVSPTAMFGLPGPYVWDAASARRVPAVGRAIGLYGGMTKQLPMDAYRSGLPLPRPQLLARPDPDRGRPWYVQVNVEDYLLNGNAISVVTSRGADGWPTSVVWLPAAWVYIVWQPWAETDINYYYAGGAQPLNNEDVIHVRRGADRMYPVRGVGIVEEYLSTLDRAAAEEEYERATLNGAAVPSVAVITPQANITDDVATEAKNRWVEKFGGAVREPVILPNGTQVIPLAWSPSDTQLIEARKMTLLDVANLFNLDGYWLGSPVSGMTYKTAGPQYLQILRTSLEPVLADFEDEWSYSWLPRGQTVQFDRNKLLADDFATTAQAVSVLVSAGVIDAAQGAALLGLPATLQSLGITYTVPEKPPAPPAPPPPPIAPTEEAPPEEGATAP
jgi:HK97 family phage portal protein